MISAWYKAVWHRLFKSLLRFSQPVCWVKTNQANRTFGQLLKPNANNIAILIGLKFKLEYVNFCFTSGTYIDNTAARAAMMWLCNYDDIGDNPDLSVICRGYLHMRTQLVRPSRLDSKSRQGNFICKAHHYIVQWETRELTKHSGSFVDLRQTVRTSNC